MMVDDVLSTGPCSPVLSSQYLSQRNQPKTTYKIGMKRDGLLTSVNPRPCFSASLSFLVAKMDAFAPPAIQSRDSIEDIWGPRTPYKDEWLTRVDKSCDAEPDSWVQSACVLCRYSELRPLGYPVDQNACLT